MFQIGWIRLLIFSFITILIGNTIFILIESVLTQFLELNQSDVTTGIGSDFDTFKLIYFILLVPLLEELSFRLFLNGKRNHVAISLSLICGFFLTGAMLNIKFANIQEEYFKTVLVFFPFFSLATLLIFIDPLNPKPSWYLTAITKAVKDNQRFFYYFSSVMFGLMHPMYVLFANQSIYFIIIDAMNFAFIGAILAQLRISSGFRYAVLLHLFYNALSFLPPL